MKILGLLVLVFLVFLVFFSFTGYAQASICDQLILTKQTQDIKQNIKQVKTSNRIPNNIILNRITLDMETVIGGESINIAMRYMKEPQDYIPPSFTWPPLPLSFTYTHQNLSYRDLNNIHDMKDRDIITYYNNKFPFNIKILEFHKNALDNISEYLYINIFGGYDRIKSFTLTMNVNTEEAMKWCSPKQDSVILISPEGVVTSNKPTFTWNHIPGVNKYLFHLDDLNKEPVFRRWFTSKEANCNGTCSISIDISEGNYVWMMTFQDGKWSKVLNLQIKKPQEPKEPINEQELKNCLQMFMDCKAKVF